MLTWTACRKADTIERNPSNVLNDIYATIEGLGTQRLFEARTSNDTLYFDIPYYYPENSDEESDLSKIILRATIPADSKISPAIGVPMDLTSPRIITITSGTGETSEYVVVGRKVGNVEVQSAKIEYSDENGAVQEIDAIVRDSEILFYVLPDIDLSNAVLTYTINRHSQGSITNGSNIDLSNPLLLTIEGAGDIKKVFTLKATEPIKLEYGFGINRKLWTKQGDELSFTNNNETGLAVSGNHLVITTRTNPSEFRIYDRFTGEYVDKMKNPLPAGMFAMQTVGDQHDNLMLTSWAPKGAKFVIYRYESALDQNPVKMLEWVNNNSGNVAADGGVGRRVNVYGDLKGKAIIMAHAGQSDLFYKWYVNDGVIENSVPEIVTYLSRTASTSLGYYPEAQPISTDKDANFFLVYQSDVALVNGITGAKISSFSPINGAVFNSSAAYAPFNNASYFAYIQFNWSYDLNRTRIVMYDVTNPSKIGMATSDPGFSSFNVYKSTELNGTKNGGTSDIAIGFSPDGDRMQIYMLLTNGGILAHEFTKYAP